MKGLSKSIEVGDRLVPLANWSDMFPPMTVLSRESYTTREKRWSLVMDNGTLMQISDENIDRFYAKIDQGTRNVNRVKRELGSE